MESKYYAPSVDMAARILNYLSRYKTKKSSLTEISKALEINKSTCLRILKTLESHNLIFHDVERRKYSLGIYTAVLGSRVYETLDYLSYIQPYLEKAAENSGLTAAFIQRISAERMMFVSKHEASGKTRMTISVGNKFPITDVSYGKWLLAYMPDEERDEILSKGLKKVTDKTETNIEKYVQQLEEIKETGFLISREEYTEGVCAVSSPVFDRTGTVIGVIAVIGMSSTLTNEDVCELAKTIKEVGEQCTSKFVDFIFEDQPFKVLDRST